MDWAVAKQLNYKHLRYFYTIAQEGSIVGAARVLHVSPQTISGQLSQFEGYLGSELFERKGKRLVLNEAGELAYSYAEDIFALGSQFQQSFNTQLPSKRMLFTVGVIDVIPKILAAQVLQKSFELEASIKLVCREGDFDTLLGQLALNKIDLILSDRPVPAGTPLKAFSHQLGHSGTSFYASRASAAQLKMNFPRSLDAQPFLISSDKSHQRHNLRAWFELEQIAPLIVAEFDDSALMKFFGQSGHGVFSTPSIIEAHVLKQYDVAVIGRCTSVVDKFYAISAERKVKHPGVKLLVDYARNILHRSV